TVATSTTRVFPATRRPNALPLGSAPSETPPSVTVPVALTRVYVPSLGRLPVMFTVPATVAVPVTLTWVTLLALEKLTLSELPALMLKAPVASLRVPAAVRGSSVPPETVPAPPTPLLPVRVAPEATVTEVLASVLPRKSVPPLRAIDPIVPPPLRFSVPVPLRVKVVAVSAPVWVRVPDTESWPLVSVVGQPLLTVVAEEVTPLPPLPATVRVLAPAQVRETALAPAPKTRVRVTALIVPLTRGLRRMALLGIVTSSARVGTLLVDQLAGLFHCRLAVPAQSMLAARTAGAASSTKASSDLPRSEVLMPALLLLEPR